MLQPGRSGWGVGIQCHGRLPPALAYIPVTASPLPCEDDDVSAVIPAEGAGAAPCYDRSSTTSWPTMCPMSSRMVYIAGSSGVMPTHHHARNDTLDQKLTLI